MNLTNDNYVESIQAETKKQSWQMKQNQYGWRYYGHWREKNKIKETQQM